MNILIVGYGNLGRYTSNLLTEQNQTYCIKHYDIDPNKTMISASELIDYAATCQQIYYCVSFNETDSLDLFLNSIQFIKRLMPADGALIVRTTLPLSSLDRNVNNVIDAYWPAFETEAVLNGDVDTSLSSLRFVSPIVGLTRQSPVFSNIEDFPWINSTTFETAVLAKLATNNSIVDTNILIQGYLNAFQERRPHLFIDKDIVTSSILAKLRNLTYTTPFIGGSCLNKDLDLAERPSTKANLSLAHDFHKKAFFRLLCTLRDEQITLVFRGVVGHSMDTSWVNNNFIRLLFSQLDTTKTYKFILADLGELPSFVFHKQALQKFFEKYPLIEPASLLEDATTIVVDFQPITSTYSASREFNRTINELLRNNPTKYHHLKLFSGH